MAGKLPLLLFIHVVLFPAVTPGRSSLPSADNFANYVAAAIPSKWRHVAIQLGLSNHKCMAIKKDEDDCFDRFMAVFEEWERGACKPFTWSTLITALESPSVAEIEIAKKLMKCMGSS